MNKLFGTIGIGILIILFLVPVSMGQDGNQNDIKRSKDEKIKERMDSMVPMFGNVAQSMMKGTLLLLSKPETAKLLAKFTRNYYKALLSEGFSDEEALKIVIETGIPNAQ